jgi:hypothetical protein
MNRDSEFQASLDDILITEVLSKRSPRRPDHQAEIDAFHVLAGAAGTEVIAMPDRYREVGRTIESQRRALAEAVVLRQYQLQPGLRERYGEDGRAKCIQDTEYHIACLATAVMFASPSLFCDYIAWAKAVLAAHGVGTEDVVGNLVCLRDVLGEQLSGGMGKAIGS